MSADAPFLEVLNGPLKGTQFRLVGESALIGRAPECDIQLEGVKGVSRQHAQVLITEDRLHIKDLGSQNGTLVDGKRVSEASVPSGSTIKIGQASLRVHGISASTAGLPAATPARESSRRLRPSKTRKSPPAEAGEHEVGAPQGGAPGQRLDAESIMVAAGESSRSFLFTIIFLVVGLGGGLYAVNALLRDTRAEAPRHWIVWAGEKRVVGVPERFSTWKTEGTTADGAPLIRAEEYKGLLSEAIAQVNDRNRKTNHRGLHFLVVIGNRQGDARLHLENGAGKTVRTLDILVRGSRPYDWREPVNPAEAIGKANQLVREARLLQQDGHLYLAMRDLNEASDLYGEAGDSDRKRRAWNEAKLLERKLATEMGRAFASALAKAFPAPNLRQRTDYKTAYRELEDVKRMIPDEESLEWQIVDRWQGRLRKLIRAR